MSKRSPGSALQRVVDTDRAVGVLGADPVQEQVHRAQPRDAVHDLAAAQRLEAQVALLVAVEERVVAGDVVVRGEQEAAGAAGRVADRLAGRGRITSTIALISGRGVKYWPAPLLTSSAFFSQQALVGVALHVGIERHPLLAVDQVDDQPAQLGRVLDLVLRLAEDDAEHPGSTAELVSTRR